MSNLNIGSTGYYGWQIFSSNWTTNEKFIYNGGTLSFSFAWGQKTSLDNAGGGKTRTFTGSATNAKMWWTSTDDAGTYTYSNSIVWNTFNGSSGPTGTTLHIPVLKIYKGHS